MPSPANLRILPPVDHEQAKAALCRMQVQVQLSEELLSGLTKQLCNSNTSTAAQTPLLSSTASLLPDCTVFLPAHSTTSPELGTSDVDQQHSTSSVQGAAQEGEVAQPSRETPAPVLCFEIKPKWGLLPTSPAIPARHAVKRQKSRFQLHQTLKLAQVYACFAYDMCHW